MNHDEYQQAQEKIFTGLACRRPSVKGPRSWFSQQCWTKCLAWCVPLILGVAISALPLGLALPKSFSGFCLIMTGMLCIGALLLYLIGMCVRSSRADILEILEDGLARFGRGVVVNEKQARKISKLTQKYPQLVEVCIYWASSNRQGQLSSRDAVSLFKAAKALEVLEEKFASYQRAQQVLEENGLAGAMQASHQQAQLGAHTPPAPAPSGRLRV